MRFFLLALLASWAAAQDPRLAQDQRHQHHLASASPVVSPAPAEATDIDLSTAALTSPAAQEGSSVWSIGKKLFNVAILGRPVEEDTVRRDERDRADGVERIMKENWDLMENGDAEDVWVILISGPPRDLVDQLYLEAHKNATRLARTQGGDELKHVHWARLDYMRESEICTRWLLFRAPVLALVSDRGRTVRWAPKWVLSGAGQELYDTMRTGEWKQLPVWQSRFAPGGKWTYLIDYYISGSKKVSEKTSRIPNFIWMGATAALTQAVVKWLFARPALAVAAAPTHAAGTARRGPASEAIGSTTATAAPSTRSRALAVPAADAGSGVSAMENSGESGHTARKKQR